MKKMSQDDAALKISSDNREAQLLEKFNSEENERIGTKEENPPNNKLNQNNVNIMAFSEFMKEKVKEGYHAPSKIPGVRQQEHIEKSPKAKLEHRKTSFSPNLKKCCTNDFKRSSKSKTQKKEASPSTSK